MTTPCIPVLPLFSRRALQLAEEIIAKRWSDRLTIQALKDDLVLPLINKIDFRTGLSNSPDYLAWRLLHSLRR